MDAAPAIAARVMPHHPAAQRPRWQAHLDRPRIGPIVQIGRPKHVEWNVVDFRMSNLAPALGGVTLLHLTDVHVRRRWPTGLDAVIARLKQQPVDFVLFGGDLAHFIHHIDPALPAVERLVTNIRGRVGTFAVLGNHDSDLLEPKLQEWGVRVLGNTRVQVPINGENLELIGLPGPDRRDVNTHFIDALPPRDSRTPRIMLSHYPDLIRYALPAQPDLYLTGHTHGGQICWPNGFPIVTHDSLPRRYSSGVHRFKDTCLVVNRGLGCSWFLPMRMFCPPEVIEIRLSPA